MQLGSRTRPFRAVGIRFILREPRAKTSDGSLQIAEELSVLWYRLAVDGPFLNFPRSPRTFLRSNFAGVDRQTGRISVLEWWRENSLASAEFIRHIDKGPGQKPSMTEAMSDAPD
jgi:hypothetical protein